MCRSIDARLHIMAGQLTVGLGRDQCPEGGPWIKPIVKTIYKIAGRGSTVEGSAMGLKSQGGFIQTEFRPRTSRHVISTRATYAVSIK